MALRWEFWDPAVDSVTPSWLLGKQPGERQMAQPGVSGVGDPGAACFILLHPPVSATALS